MIEQQLNGKVVIWSSVSSILCMIAAGYLAGISWRWVFRVYLFGIPCMILCRKYIPNVTVASEGNQISLSVIRKTGLYAIGTFVIFFGMALAVSTLNAEAGMACSKDEALSAGTVIMVGISFFLVMVYLFLLYKKYNG